jgi:membrane protein
VLENAVRPPGAVERIATRYRPTVHYLMQVEVHVYAFSMAANVLLSFFPFLIVMVSLCRYVLEWKAAEEMIFLALQDYFPDQLGDFLRRNLRVTVASRGPFQFISVVLLLYTANGIFEPVEVALNRAWGIPKNRSYFKNQLISLGLIFICGGLALVSAVLAAINQELWSRLGFLGPEWSRAIALTAFKTAMVPALILLLILVYWVLPNGRVPVRPIVPVAIVVGLLLEVLKYAIVLIWPWLRRKLEMEYGPFVYSVTIILWGFLASMIVLAGAEWAARRHLEPPRKVAGEEPLQTPEQSG